MCATMSQKSADLSPLRFNWTKRVSWLPNIRRTASDSAAAAATAPVLSFKGTRCPPRRCMILNHLNQTNTGAGFETFQSESF